MPAPDDATPLEVVAFGDPDAGVWGLATAGTLGIARIGGERREQLTLSTDSRTTAEEWDLRGDDLELSVSPLGAAASFPAGLPAERVQICRVHGHATVGGEGERIDCLGMRGEHRGLGGATGSWRAAYLWFSGEQAMALTAARPRRAPGHDRDALAATVLEGGSALTSVDPRLSTTLDEAGAPLRVGLELWIESEDGTLEFPRRASGMTIDPALTVRTGRLRVRGYPLRCHSRGQTGGGVYLQADPA
ncbi:MAG: hypothetical protein M3Z27_02110 [Actinomycetota bacterium]|nr:hypothetical protein [Actinomycetota bacterium]